MNFEPGPIEPWMVNTALRVYKAALAAIDEFSSLRNAAATQSWVETLRNVEITSRTWEMEARRFREAKDTATLMHTYSRGLPHMIVQTLAASDAIMIKNGNTQWAISMADQAGDVSKQLADAIVQNRDVERVHRLQAFPMIAVIQSLAHLPPNEVTTRNDLCGRLAQLLRDTQVHGHGYSDSACDQINQILPQILTDQLLAGPHAWSYLFVTDGVLKYLIDLIKDPDKARSFEAGAALGIQFLHYYKKSLSMRKLPDWAKRQEAYIDDAFELVGTSRDPVLRNLSKWSTHLQSYVDKATNHAEPYKNLMQQTSAAIIAHAYENHTIPAEIQEFCVVNNLRSVCCSDGLPDEAERLKRVRVLLSDHGITRDFALSAIEQWMTSESRNKRIVKEFADSLPDTASRPPENPNMISTQRGMTLDDLQAEIARLNYTPKPLAGIEGVITRIVVRYAYSLDVCGLITRKQEERKAEIKKVVKRALEEMENQ